MKIPRLTTLGLMAGLIVFASFVVVQLVFRMEITSHLTEQQAAHFVTALRAGLEPENRTTLPMDLEQVADDKLMAVLTVWVDGRRRKVFQVDRRPLREIFAAMGDQLAELGNLATAERLRLQVDFVIATGWIPQTGVLATLAFVEGHDGISGVIDGRRVFLPPSELVRNDKYGGFQPLPAYEPRFLMGINIEKTKRTIRFQARQLGINGDEVTDLSRFRVLTMVEGNDLIPRRLRKGTVDRPPVNQFQARASALAGAEYLDRALGTNGIYRYYYNPVLNRNEHGAYNWPRHAGVSYSLALVGRILERPEFVKTARRALERFEEQLVNGPSGSRCLESGNKCYLGSSALGLLALAEYRLASGDKRFDETAGKVAAFLKSMRRSDTDFYHDWYPDKGTDKALQKLYASGQAVFALARYAKAMGDKSALDMAEQVMDYFAGPYWDHFLGTFYYGQEHWTCLAAEEVYAARPKPAYAELCYGIGQHYDNITHRSLETTPYIEDVGGMALTHLMTPHVGGTATAAEAMVSSVILGDAIGADTSELKAQLKATFNYLIRGQVTIHDTFWMRRPEYGIGGFFESHSKPKIRIDTVQHAISALVRGLDYLPAEKITP